MVIAQAVLGLPIVAALIHRALDVLWREYGDALRMDGASRGRAGLELLRIARGALLTAFLAAFGRATRRSARSWWWAAISAATRTMTTTIALDDEPGRPGPRFGARDDLDRLSVMVSAGAFALNRLVERS